MIIITSITITVTVTVTVTVTMIIIIVTTRFTHVHRSGTRGRRCTSKETGYIVAITVLWPLLERSYPCYSDITKT